MKFFTTVILEYYIFATRQKASSKGNRVEGFEGDVSNIFELRIKRKSACDIYDINYFIVHVMNN